METPIRGIVVLGLARIAHSEQPHRRFGPVVGCPFDDREARSAIRAIDERVVVPAIARIVKLGQAVITRS
jgi:hypothetical protein